jgi:hypothetical protein
MRAPAVGRSGRGCLLAVCVALLAAVAHGRKVHASIAYTLKGGQTAVSSAGAKGVTKLDVGAQVLSDWSLLERG